jgi:DNA polymerase-3 subunit gamma/tau
VALYRTYRPATFAEVVGQDHVTKPLGRALDSGRINHAYLFSGPRGCGKTSSARILARSLNCEQGPTSTPCGTCDSCVALAPGGPGNLDVIELDAASHGGVDDTRDLRDRAHYAPSQSRYRVFIIDEAHMVTNQGFNALLKIVEEPPEHLIFVFATTEPEKVLPTIRSRTHHYPFRLLAPPVMRGLLEGICEREGVTVEPEVFPLVIRAGGGSPRDSLSILDQLLAGAGSGSERAESGAGGGSVVSYDEAMSLLGVTDVALIDDAVDALAAGDGAALFGTVEDVVNAGHDPRRFAVDLLERLRDLILLQAVPEAAERGLVEAPGDQVEKMRAQIDGLGSAMLTRAAETVHTALGEMRGTTSPRLLLEVMCARLLLPETSADDAALLARLERLEAGGLPAAVGSPSLRAAGALSSVSVPTSELVTGAPAADARAAAAPAPAASAPAPDDGAPLKYTRRSQRVPESTEPDPAPSEPESALTEPETLPSEPETALTEPEPAPELEPAPGEAPSGLTLEEVQRRFGEVRAAMREHSPVFEAMLSGAFIHQVAESLITVGHTAEALAARLSQEERAQALRASFAKVFGTEIDVRTIHAQPGTGPAEAGTVPAAAQQPKQSYRRPSRGGAEDTSDEVIPEPEEPSPEPRPDEEISDAERDEMVAQAHDDSPSSQVRDPEEVALELLQSELGARVLDES